MFACVMQTVLVCGRMMAAAAADTAVIPDPSQQNSPTNKDVHTPQVVFLCLRSQL